MGQLNLGYLGINSSWPQPGWNQPVLRSAAPQESTDCCPATDSKFQGKKKKLGLLVQRRDKTMPIRWFKTTAKKYAKKCVKLPEVALRHESTILMLVCFAWCT